APSVSRKLVHRDEIPPRLATLLTIQTQCSPGKACNVEVPLTPQTLELQDSPQAVRSRLGCDGLGKPLEDGSVRHSFGHHPSDQIAFWLPRESEDSRRRGADIGVADGQRIDIAGFEIRPDRCHKI